MPSCWPETSFRLCCPAMELRQLRNFVAVAEQGNISRAAKSIFLTQPALSRQIKALEDEIGQCLLKREAHSIRLTPAGEMLLREARELLQRADACQRPLVRSRREFCPEASERARGIVRPLDEGNADRTGKRHLGCRAHGRLGP